MVSRTTYCGVANVSAFREVADAMIAQGDY